LRFIEGYVKSILDFGFRISDLPTRSEARFFTREFALKNQLIGQQLRSPTKPIQNLKSKTQNPIVALLPAAAKRLREKTSRGASLPL
jgi:hypothetical protein